jgi:hypothetical protein
MDEANKIYEARENRKNNNMTKKEEKQKQKDDYEAKMKAAKEKGL